MSKLDSTKPEVKSVDEQLQDVVLLEKQADLKIKLAKLREIDGQEEIRKRNAETAESSLKDFNHQQALEKYNCTHLKGGRDGNGRYDTGDDNRNHSVFINRYPSGERVVHCTRCQAEWHPGDTTDYLIRDGRKVSNPTRKSYQEALKMAAQSTNRESSSITFTITKNEVASVS